MLEISDMIDFLLKPIYLSLKNYITLSYGQFEILFGLTLIGIVFFSSKYLVKKVKRNKKYEQTKPIVSIEPVRKKGKLYAKCSVCGKGVYLPYQCNYCGGYFCDDHKHPPKHNCPELHLWKKGKPPSGVGFEYTSNRETKQKY